MGRFGGTTIFGKHPYTICSYCNVSLWTCVQCVWTWKKFPKYTSGNFQWYYRISYFPGFIEMAVFQKFHMWIFNNIETIASSVQCHGPQHLQILNQFYIRCILWGDDCQYNESYEKLICVHLGHVLDSRKFSLESSWPLFTIREVPLHHDHH